jgi:transcriptional regulator with XRE-family HTH domain
MSYGHADKLAAIVASTPAAGSEKSVPPIDPALYQRDDVRAVLAERDIGALYRVLRDEGITQRRIAELTGQSQSEVSEILKGRRVRDVTVLERIAKGLGIPRELMGLSYGDSTAYRGEVTVVSGEVGDDVQRRDALAVGFLATFGSVPSFVALLDRSAAPRDIPLPSRLGASDIAEIKNTTEQLRAAARLQGGQARAASAAATYYRRLTAVPAAEQVTRSLESALAELDELAGWCCHDAGLDRHTRWHYRTAADLARRVGDDYRVASALRCAGLVDSRRDRPNDAMKLYQIAGVKLGNQDADLRAWLDAVSPSLPRSCETA